jgi:hypothetical protein
MEEVGVEMRVGRGEVDMSFAVRISFHSVNNLFIHLTPDDQRFVLLVSLQVCRAL